MFVSQVEYDDECANHVPSTPLAEQLSSIKEEADSPKRRKLCMDSIKTDRLPELAQELQFSFEKEPRSEPWYNTYRRQDDHSEYLEGFEDFRFRKRLVLPYEMPEFQRLFASKNRSVTKQSTPPNRNKFSVRSRAMQLVADAKNPRKSPRCHASTRAIQSDNPRRRRGMSSPETEVLQPILDVTISDVDKTLDEMLASPSTPQLSPAGRVRRKSARKALTEEDADGDDLVAELTNAGVHMVELSDLKSCCELAAKSIKK